MRIHWVTYEDGVQRPYGLEPGNEDPDWVPLATHVYLQDLLVQYFEEEDSVR